MSAHLLTLVTVFAVIGPGTHALAAVAGGPAAQAGEPQLEVSGIAPDLIPGRPVRAEVRISNPLKSPAAVRVTRLTARVSDASTACPAGNIRVSSYRWTPTSRTYSAAPGTSVVVPLTMTLVETGGIQNACQGARFPIRFTVESASI